MKVNILYEPYFTEQPETVKPLALFIGGRNSGKSRAVAQKFAVDMLEKPARRALVRKVADSIRDSQYKEIRDVVTKDGLEGHFNFTVNPLAIRTDTGSETVCKGCDDPEKLKSLAEVQDVWIEEFSEITQNDWETIDLSVRGESDKPKRITATMNPVICFVKDYFFLPNGELRYPEQVYYLHSTWRDNRFRGDDWEARMEIIRQRSETLYKRVSEGLWTQLEGLVYRVSIVDKMPDGIEHLRRGMDFGTNDPTTLLDVAFHEGKFFLDEHFYESNLTEDDIHRRMMDAGLWETRYVRTLCDTSHKMIIDGLSRRGWNVVECHKTKLIDRTKWGSGFEICITKRSVNAIREFGSCVYALDKWGKPLEVPVDFDNHTIDAANYGMEDLSQRINEADFVYEAIGEEEEHDD